MQNETNAECRMPSILSILSMSSIFSAATTHPLLANSL